MLRRGPRFFPLSPKPESAPDLWVKCDHCSELLYRKEWERAFQVCSKCGHHFRMSAPDRVGQLADEDSFVELHRLEAVDPLKFVSEDKPYAERLAEASAQTGLPEAILSGRARLEGVDVSLAVCDFGFLAGSMGTVVGERVTRSIELALEESIPLVIVAASGGARMHEGLLSLLQMAKTSSALTRLARARLPYFCVLTDPTLGGVTASFASLADVILAEPGALIGFAGPRVIEQVTKQKLPPKVNTAEFRLGHGFVDLLVPRRDLKPTLARLLNLYTRGPL
ncbi:MAG: acetyl-CoA carboxylase carboxyltransferase subunit beta [Chloroflexi bacterium]|nr:acetyl-CoA carboxylase carboxyltransferase subunit beta [Chloroflexota bacterium]